MFEKLISALTASVVRHGATALAGYLVAQGYADNSQGQQLIGCAVWLGGFAFSIYDKWQAKKKLAAAQKG